MSQKTAPASTNTTRGNPRPIAKHRRRGVTGTVAEGNLTCCDVSRQLSRDDIAAIVAAFADLARVVREADPADKAELYAQLKLTLTYQPD